MSHNKYSWSNLLRIQQQQCKSLHYHSSITTTIEMPDFDSLLRQFQTVISPTALSATKCRLCRYLESAAMAVARSATTECLLQKGRSPLCASSRAQGRRRPPAVAGSVSCCSEHHCPATAANQQQMHCAACHPPVCAATRLWTLYMMRERKINELNM